MRVGMARMSYFAVVDGFCSTSSFTTLTLPLRSVATASSAGDMALHGLHHSAKKSTTTGSDDCSTSASKFASETKGVASLMTSVSWKSLLGVSPQDSAVSTHR